MKIKKLISIFAVSALIVTAMPAASSAAEFEGDYIENEVNFIYTQTVENEDDFCCEANISQELSGCGVISLKELPMESVYDTAVKQNSDGTFTKTTVFNAVTDVDTAAACRALERLDSVELAEPNYLLEEDEFTMPREITNSTTYYTNYTKWWFENIIHIPEAWEEFNTFGEGVVVAVIDSGVFVNNVEIDDNIWEDAAGHRGYNAESNTYECIPASGHGGNVAGIVAAEIGSNGNLIGVAPKSKIMPIKVSRNSMSISIDAMVAGINYAMSNGADIITMSLGTTGTSTLLENACNEAYRSGIILTASASNNAQDLAQQKSYPSCYNSVIGVMALDNDGQTLCNFSNYDSTNQLVHFALPGRTILGLPKTEGSTTGLTGMSGTSQATPILAGLAALYKSVYPDHTPGEFIYALENSSTRTCVSNPNVVTTQYTYKVPDALSLLRYSNTMPSVTAYAGTTTVIDDTAGYIYGIEENYFSIDDYVSVIDGSYELIPTENGQGTGSVFRVYALDGQVFRDYIIIIFGDTDGDSVCDARDYALCEFAADSGTVPDYVSFAADVDFDDAVTPSDSGIIARCGVFTDFVSQIR
ncbi:MAG: S8 family serine peptidase [Clostridia bacterium]|nr:S8 family serine peptidase [Clostridia bacterium]